MRYEATPVLFAEGLTSAEVSIVLELKVVNGSLISPDGEVSGVGRLEEKLLALLKRRLEERAVLLDVGEARRDSVLRKVDLRLGGVGRDCMLRGTAGRVTPG